MSTEVSESNQGSGSVSIKPVVITKRLMDACDYYALISGQRSTEDTPEKIANFFTELANDLTLYASVPLKTAADHACAPRIAMFEGSLAQKQSALGADIATDAENDMSYVIQAGIVKTLSIDPAVKHRVPDYRGDTRLFVQHSEATGSFSTTSNILEATLFSYLSALEVSTELNTKYNTTSFTVYNLRFHSQG